MLISKTAKVKWNAKIKQHYVDLGYVFTKMKDEFEVDVNDLTSGSSAYVEVECDYCGKHYSKQWYHYLAENQNSHIQKDCCTNCRKIKTAEYVKSEYGVENVFMLDDIKEKCKETNTKLYGSENPFSSDVIKEKIAETNIKKYGHKSPMQNKAILEKARQTCLDRYGVDYYVMTQARRGEDNPVWKGGVSKIRNERYMYEYQTWRKSVYARDRYTCQCCENKNGVGNKVVLNAHHIMNWKDNPDLRYDIENGITLCEDCHVKFHRVYGKHNNDKAQLDLFINTYGKKLC